VTLKLTGQPQQTHLATQPRKVSTSSVSIHSWLYANQMEEAEGTESQAEVDDPPANSGKDLGSIIAELNPVLRGFINYFRVTNCTRVMKQLRGGYAGVYAAVTAEKWKDSHRRLHRRLNKLGLRPPFQFYPNAKLAAMARSPLGKLRHCPTRLHDELGLIGPKALQRSRTRVL